MFSNGTENCTPAAATDKLFYHRVPHL
uniref:Uncharacterized protein n=1 Tax=Anguilla anguilla TaxID=7936 RepID=A0A0E9SEB9_ANGAN